jgi:hypothetical protein
MQFLQTSEFLSYALAHNISDNDLMVVDSPYPRGLNLTHLYSDRVPGHLRANTSTETVLNWLALTESERAELGGWPSFVTCNHWDIDGFLAVWSAMHPSIALKHRPELIAAAHLGDFREFDPNTAYGLWALKICSLLNHVERSTFCLPFGNLSDATIEHEVSRRKFEYFIPRFAQWLEKIDHYRILWEDEYKQVMSDIETLRKPGAIEEIPEYDLTVIRTEKPLHYYASFNLSRGGLVVSAVGSADYIEAEYKYETIVGRLDRNHSERSDLTAVAEQLNEQEQSHDVYWVFDRLHEGGPILRPEYGTKKLTREDRYQSIIYRIDKSPQTSIKIETIIEKLVAALQPAAIVA